MTHGFCQKFYWWVWSVVIILAIVYFGFGLITSDWVPVEITTYYKGSMK